MKKENSFDVSSLVNNSGCFDLQFRKDIRRERTNSPTYYRWKTQFIVTVPKEQLKILEKIKRAIGCGRIHIIKNQARFSVQKIDDIANYIIPFFKKNKLIEKKKKDFELWQRAVYIIYQNKGKYIAKWKKNDLLSLIQIHKSTFKYKNNPRESKWIKMAQNFIKKL